jgi:hypothetical protein
VACTRLAHPGRASQETWDSGAYEDATWGWTRERIRRCRWALTWQDAVEEEAAAVDKKKDLLLFLVSFFVSRAAVARFTKRD